jgi:hypothetical protein
MQRFRRHGAKSRRLTAQSPGRDVTIDDAIGYNRNLA